MEMVYDNEEPQMRGMEMVYDNEETQMNRPDDKDGIKCGIYINF